MLLLWVAVETSACRNPQATEPLTAPARALSVSNEAAERLLRRWSEAPDVSSRFQLTVTERELTSLVAISLGPSPLTSLSLWIEPGNLYVEAELDAYGARSLRAVLRSSVDDGRPQVHLERASLDGTQVPRFILASAEAALNSAIYDANLPVLVHEIALQKGLAVITCSTAPRGQ